MTEWLAQNGNLITALATVAIAVLTGFLAFENRRLRKAGTEPEVVAYLLPHPDGNGAINFVLENIGQGLARNVKFTLNYDEDDFERHNVMLVNDTERSYIGVLPQGGRVQTLFGVGYELAGKGSEGALKQFAVRATYDDLNGQTKHSDQWLDVAQFLGMKGLFAKPASRDAADSLRKIEGHLGKIAKTSRESMELLDTTPFEKKSREWKPSEQGNSVPVTKSPRKRKGGANG